MRVLVTGSDGYLGSLLTPVLIERGHQVTGVDTCFYRHGWLGGRATEVPRTRVMDVRSLQVDDLAGHDAVIHLGELSNDPLGEVAPECTRAINHAGSVRLAGIAKAAGVGRFVYMSSCSVYGAHSGGAADESSPLNPLTEYARCKALVERDVAALQDRRFSAVFLRNATAFGASPRMRFDLVVNDLAAAAYVHHRVRMTSDGTPWRPLVHALDICQAVWRTLEAPREVVHGEVFNVGEDRLNYQVSQIAEVVAGVFGGCSVELGSTGADSRSYRVSFAKLREHLPEFHCQWDLASGTRQLREFFERVGLTESLYRAPAFTRVAQLRRLLAAGELTGELYWASRTGVSA